MSRKNVKEIAKVIAEIKFLPSGGIMRVISLLVCLLVLVINGISFAQEKKYIFLGQNEIHGDLETTFILEIKGADCEKHMKITNTGEIYLKVDHILAVSKDAIAYSDISEFLSDNDVISSALSSSGEEWSIHWKCPRCSYGNSAFRNSCANCGYRPSRGY